MCMFRYSMILHCVVAIIIILSSGQFSSNAAVIDRRFLTSKPIKLVNGHSSTEGKVLIYENNNWISVCANGWDYREAQVVCRMLGLSTHHSEAYTVGNRYHHLAYYIHYCRGSESDLKQCSYTNYKQQWCSDVSVRCHGEHHFTTGHPHAAHISTTATVTSPQTQHFTAAMTTAQPTKMGTSTAASASTKATGPTTQSNLSTAFAKPSTTINNLTPTPLVVNTFSIKDCRDTRTDCSVYANYCNLFGNWEAHECPVTCGFCTPTSNALPTTTTSQLPASTSKPLATTKTSMAQTSHWVTIPLHTKWVTIPTASSG